MSGFVGWVEFEGDLSAQENVLHAMTEAMQHRGPDAKGVWSSRHAALGHRALITTPPAGPEQPLCLETGTGPVVVAHTGEISNAAALAARLGRAPGSTADLLLHAFLRWGAGCVERFNGAFGFAIWDGREQRLILGRDRMGVQPLYYFTYPGGVIFASEPKGIMANPRFTARLDLTALPIVLQPRLTMPGETPLAGLFEVPPAHLVSHTADGQTRHRYWELTSAPHHDTFDETARHVRELLTDIVGEQLTAAVPMGAMLSGGLDSTSVAALAAHGLRERSGTTLQTFCVRFDSDPAHFVATELRPDVDAPYAQAAADHLGTPHTTVTAGLPDLLGAIPATRRARDLPGWGQFDASMYLLFQRMRQSCVVGLSGEAADEVFGGYPYFFRPDVRRRDGFPWLFDGPKLTDCLSPEVTAVVDPGADERARYAQLLGSVPRLPGEDPDDARMRELFFLGLSGPLAVVLDRKERMSMAHGLEVRLPFCDHRLVQYVWNVPWAMKTTGGVKGLLKAAMADVVPASVLNRAKSAYPHVQNPAYDQTLVRAASAVVNDRASPVAALFDSARLNGLIQQVDEGRLHAELPGGSNPAALLIQLVELHCWIDEYHVSLN